MANREELALIRGARAGRAGPQLELGKRYLFGSAGLPKSLPTALHWLDRAAQQGCTASCELIGAHIPFEVAAQSQRPVALWFERAYDAGVVRAGIVLAQLTLSGQGGQGGAPARQAKALAALDGAARAGIPEAQWLLSEHRSGAAGAMADIAGASLQRAAPAGLPAQPGAAHWPGRTAAGGVAPAQFAPLDRAWEAGQWSVFLERAVPLARALLLASEAACKGPEALSPPEVVLLSRCAQALSATVGQGLVYGVDDTELRRIWETAAAAQDRHAQLAVGLWHARMQIDGTRICAGAGSANFKKAIRWLTLAGEQGMAEAWYALSRIYIKPEFSQRNVLDAQRYLERAAEMGYRDAQLECGNGAWRSRRENESNDVRAVYWLQKAAAQGCGQAAAALARIAPRLPGTVAGGMAGAVLRVTHPLLAARLELAAVFGLSRAEALLLDVRSADHGHCLVVDIRGSYGRSKRRLIAIDGDAERAALDRIARLFDGIESGPGGPEGNYRQRLYRLKTVLPEAAGEAEDGPHDDIAAKGKPTAANAGVGAGAGVGVGVGAGVGWAAPAHA